MELPGGVWGNPNCKANDLQIGQCDTDQYKVCYESSSLFHVYYLLSDLKVESLNH